MSDSVPSCDEIGASRDPWIMTLPEQLDYSTCEEIAEALEHLRDTPVSLNASDVRHVGGLGVQLLVSIKMQWLKDGADFEVVAPSSAFVQALNLLGVPEDLFQESETA